ncbi:MAG: transporter substrate-binding domain-containing protein [Eubacteriales bacterium]|nr:transporter substrate-binding domain-containing protein [Eubacteriales bacterium]
MIKKTIVFIWVILLLTAVIAFMKPQSANAASLNLLRVGFDPNLPPYQYYEDGEYKGLLIDLMNQIAKDSNLEIELVPMPLSEAIEHFKLKEIDMILGIRYTRSLEEVMDFSDSLVQSKVSFIMPNEESEEIRNKLNVEPFIIAVERDSAEYEFVKNIKKANFNLAFNQESVIALLLMGRADTMIGVRHVAEYTFDKYNLTDAYTISDVYETPVYYHLGVSFEMPGLMNLINNSLRDIKLSGDYEHIYNRWINDLNAERQKQMVRYMTILSIGTLLVILTGLLVNLQLKRKVNIKTKELSDSNLQLEDKILEIRQSNDLKNLIVESSPRSIVIFDNEGKIISMNESSLKLCGCEKPLIGESVYELVPINLMLGSIERVLKNGESFVEKEMAYVTPQKQMTFRYVIYPLFDHVKTTRGAIITIEDVTEEKILRAQAQEKEKNQALVQIISGIAHEIRNPLTSIKTYIELLPRKKDNLEFQRQIATVVPHEVERVNKLIEQLIDYAKPREKIIELANLTEVIDYCITLFKPILQKNGIVLNKKTDRDFYIMVDMNQLKQVIINLFLNAIDAINERKSAIQDDRIYRIDIEVIRNIDRICISVDDNGIGMTEDELKNVFELFYTTKVGGSGIGLPLSRQLVEDNDGTIHISSDKNKGSKILITFKGVFHEEESVNH